MLITPTPAAALTSRPPRHRSWWQRMTRTERIVGAVGAGALASFGIYRSWHMRWGATDDELGREMPGDEVVREPMFNATRAITIDASPREVWPWIAQIGFGRAGWYSYDWLDNLGRPSANRIIPELQNVGVGTLIPMGPGKESGLRVRGLDLNRWNFWSDRKGMSTWAWGLYPAEGGRTRLITRVRTRYQWTKPAILFSLLLVEPWDFPMMRKCMLGIQRRAQALARQA
jgi:hypothetical protein